MAVYRRILSVANIADLHLRFRDAVRLAEQVEAVYTKAGQPGIAAATRRELLRAYSEFNRGLNDIARATSRLATREIKAELARTRRRPDTGHAPHLARAIVSRPLRRFGALATGEVGIADIEVLDTVVNPYGPQYGPYWRAQEQGTTHQAGRVVYGGFYGSGGDPGPFKPDPAFRFPGHGPHPVFISTHAARAALSAAGFHGRGPGRKGGAGGGKMTISVELPARKFIETGANAADAAWRADLASLEQAVTRHLRATVAAPARRRPAP